jgi:Na+(H+)/acetate symporter ActP
MKLLVYLLMSVFTLLSAILLHIWVGEKTKSDTVGYVVSGAYAGALNGLTIGLLSSED